MTVTNGKTSPSAPRSEMSSFSNARTKDLRSAREGEFAAVRIVLSGQIPFQKSARKDLVSALTSNARQRDSKNANRESFVVALTALSGQIGLTVMGTPSVKDGARLKDGINALNEDHVVLTISHRRGIQFMPLFKNV